MKNNQRDNGVGFLGLLGLVFITLKLTGQIDWSWWYVTLPLWGGLALVVGVVVMVLVGAVVVAVYNALIKRIRDDN